MATVTDRYQIELDCRAQVGIWANKYAAGHWYHAQESIVERWKHQTASGMEKIKGLGIAVCMSPKAEEPYGSAEEMAERVRRTGLFIVRWRSAGSHPLGYLHKDFRVVHDWFGHIVPGNPFSMNGELAAFRTHVETKLFSRDVLPLVWSEVVLENAYRLFHGHWHYISKPVFDPSWGHGELADGTATQD